MRRVRAMERRAIPSRVEKKERTGEENARGVDRTNVRCFPLPQTGELVLDRLGLELCIQSMPELAKEEGQQREKSNTDPAATLRLQKRRHSVCVFVRRSRLTRYETATTVQATSSTTAASPTA